MFLKTILGDMGVGKSCLLHQFTEKKCEFVYWNSSSLLIFIILLIRPFIWEVQSLLIHTEDVKLYMVPPCLVIFVLSQQYESCTQEGTIALATYFINCCYSIAMWSTFKELRGVGKDAITKNYVCLPSISNVIPYLCNYWTAPNWVKIFGSTFIYKMHCV